MDVPLIPLEVLFGNPERSSPRISPDASRLAWIAPSNGVLNLWVGRIGSEEAECVTDDRDRGIRSFRWAHDRAHHLLYLQDSGGDENWRVHAVDPATREDRDLTPIEGVQARIVAVEPSRPSEVLVGLNDRDPQLHDVYRLDIVSGELELVLENSSDPGFVDFVADRSLAVRAAVEQRDDGGVTIHVRDDPGSPWRPLLEAGLTDALTTHPVGFDRAGSGLLVVSSEGAPAGRLMRIDCDRGTAVTVVAGDAHDVAGVRLHPTTYEPQLAVFERERAEYVVLDESIAEDIGRARALARGDFDLVSGDDADRVWLVSFTRDDGAYPFFAFDRDTGEGTFLFEHQPALNEYTLATMRPFSFEARDGLTIHGYATLPPGAAGPMPAVLAVHGGPWARDHWGFDPIAQWLANRGYVCIQVNFRGSTGYGKAFVNAGDREWGARMHDDLLDAVDAVVARGWADREAIGILGGSYGGYAALIGATFTPGVFRCSVSLVGPSNLNTLIESIPPYWRPMASIFARRVGDPATESDFLWSRSPLSRVDRIEGPILVGQGANDPRVKRAESEQIVAAMREKGIDHEYLVYEDEGHGLAKPQNRLAFFGAAERFLGRHLGGRTGVS